MTAKLNTEEYIGKVYSRLTVKDFTREKGYLQFICSCSCGTESVVTDKYSLEHQRTKSCGCHKRDNPGAKTHGMSTSVEYRHYAAMRKRCIDESSPDFIRNKERGITICKEFLEDFMAFYSEIGKKPESSETLSVGRIDNTKGYEIGNIRWETNEQQARNHSRQKNNTSGMSGIGIYNKDGYNTIVARVNLLDRTRVSKSFGIGKYGYDVALALAINWRTEQIKELNDLGAEYQPSHGKE